MLSKLQFSHVNRIVWLGYYLLFGLIHEVCHVITAILLGLDHGLDSPGRFVLRALLGRACHIPSVQDPHTNNWQIATIYHAGWIGSVTLAAMLTLLLIVNDDVHRKTYRNNSKKSKRLSLTVDQLLHPTSFLSLSVSAAIVTAFEAICTDLLGIGTVTGFSNSNTRFVCFCGNFGVIMLNPAWTTTRGDNGKTALDLLEKMIQVTMMRGAQTGGVVCWTSKNKQPNGELTPIRSRVVNSKRTDLSKEIRKKLNKDVCRLGRIDPTIRCMLGHTRFATSSKATFDGTHPHQWTPPENRRVYPIGNINIWLSAQPKPVVQKESNFITHNGDLDFFKVNGDLADLESTQKWLEVVTGHRMPAAVDSAVIAGLIDLLRTKGCFALSIRYALLMASEDSVVETRPSHGHGYPGYKDYEKLGMIFENGLTAFCTEKPTNMVQISRNVALRKELVKKIEQKIRSDFNLEKSAFLRFSYDVPKVDGEIDEEGAKDGRKLRDLVTESVNAFFDNDLFRSTKLFMENAVGTFGLMVTCSMDAHRQICLAARGQPMSIAFYPTVGIICYGSELAAVKAGLNYDSPGDDERCEIDRSERSRVLNSDDGDGEDDTMNVITKTTCRLDMDDLGGEVVLLDFSKKDEDGWLVPTLSTHKDSKSTTERVWDRVTILDDNEFLLPLPDDTDDPILEDIHTIPRSLNSIQSNWREGGLNRVSMWNLGVQIKKRLQDRVDHKIPIDSSTVDILVTGCEVSLWLAEQFASDLQKAFPKLFIQSTSSNKLLGVFGQELAVPAVGFSMSKHTPNLRDSIVIIVSHSGGTFAPLAVSNLLQSVTKSIFLVTSEWDTQIGKQLRGMYAEEKDVFINRVFTTEIGVRPAEPCTLSVAATHQLLTQMFEYICMVVINDHHFRDISGAVVTEQDLRILESCNADNIIALERIVGCEVGGQPKETQALHDLQQVGDLWADHVLENARAYIMSFLYVFGTVTSGYPLVTGIAIAIGLDTDWAFYITRFLDAAIYFFLPQINIILIRLVQRRNLLHRMTGRTVVIGDVPWVAQAAEAFLSKIFARSYSIAGLSVASGNPADHLVHRHTHRVVRGTLLICGRPDGRLTALTSSECAVNLSVQQASSIQSIGGTCESITVGHNPSKLNLTKMDIFLGTYRRDFLCERILGVIDEETARKQQALVAKINIQETLRVSSKNSLFNCKRILSCLSKGSDDSDCDSLDSRSQRSSHSLKGAYLGLQAQSFKPTGRISAASRHNHDIGGKQKSARRSVVQTFEDLILEKMIDEKKRANEFRLIFELMDTDGSGAIDVEEFANAHEKAKSGLTREEAIKLFHEADVDHSGELTYEEFIKIVSLRGADVVRKLHHCAQRDQRGLLQIEPVNEEYFGKDLYNQSSSATSAFSNADSQNFSMELYESRIASLQRFVAMCVIFHRMGKRVQDFFPKYSFGLMRYNMERTHSIMRIATTASPISGDAVRDQIEVLRLRAKFQRSAHAIEGAWYRFQKRQLKHIKSMQDLHGSSLHGSSLHGSSLHLSSHGTAKGSIARSESHSKIE